MNDQDTLTEMRIALVTNRLRQVDVAMEMRIAESEFSRLLNGRRKLPDDFRARFYEAVRSLSPSATTTEPVNEPAAV